MFRLIYILFLLSIFLSAESLKIDLSSTKIYESELIVAKLSFDSDSNKSAIRLESRGFEAKDFEIKKLDSNITSPKKGVYRYRSIWLLKPKKIGKLIIPPQRVVIYRINKSSYLAVPKEYKTPKITVIVKKLPKDALFAGDVKLKAKVDKTQTKPNEPITLTITIKGRGDLSLIPPFNPKMKDATIFPSSIKLETKVINGAYIGKWIQKIGYSSDKDFQIPPFKIKYLNSTTNTVEVLETKAIDIDVIDSFALKKWLIYILLIIFGGLITTILQKVYKSLKRKKSDIEIAIKSAKSDKELYQLLLPYSDNREIAIWIEKLQNNIYNKKKYKIDKREIISLLTRIIESNP